MASGDKPAAMKFFFYAKVDIYFEAVERLGRTSVSTKLCVDFARMALPRLLCRRKAEEMIGEEQKEGQRSSTKVVSCRRWWCSKRVVDAVVAAWVPGSVIGSLLCIYGGVASAGGAHMCVYPYAPRRLLIRAASGLHTPARAPLPRLPGCASVPPTE